MPKTWNERTQIVNALRKVWRNSPPRRDALKAVALGKGWWKCSACKKKSEKPKIDHIIPVVDTSTGFIDWNTYINRLFCVADNLQVLCSSCHEKKTKEEKKERKLNEKKKKAD